MTMQTPYKGKLSPKQQLQVRNLALFGTSSGREAAKELDIPYGQVRGYLEWYNKQLFDVDIHPPHTPKMLVFDIETAPFLTYNWGLWQQNALAVKEYWYMLSFAYAWYDLSKDDIGDIGFVSIYQDPKFTPGTTNDKHVIDRLWALLDEADIVIGQNSKAFDVKKFTSRAIIHGHRPPEPFQQIDTKTAAAQVGQFGSNSLKHLAVQLGISLKESNRGIDLWLDCMNGDPTAWAEMESYNVADVKATADLYSRLRPWMTSNQHPNLGLYIADEGMVCTNCGNKERDAGGQGFQHRGMKRTNASAFPQVQCNHCGKYSRKYQRRPQRTAATRVDLR